MYFSRLNIVVDFSSTSLCSCFSYSIVLLSSLFDSFFEKNEIWLKSKKRCRLFLVYIHYRFYLFLQLHSGKLENGTCVAVRSMVFTKKYSVQSLRAQLDFLSKLHHPNLVGLLGHCTESCDGPSTANKVHLVYEFVPNGSYRSYLSGTRFPHTSLEPFSALLVSYFT